MYEFRGFTQKANKALNLSIESAQNFGHDYIGTEHILLGLIREIQRDMGSSVVFVTHDMSVHANMTDRVGIIYAGRLVEEGAHDALLQRPPGLYARLWAMQSGATA